MSVQARVCLANTAWVSWLDDALDGAASLAVSDETRCSALVEQIRADIDSRLLFVRVRDDTLDAATELMERIAAARPGLPIIAIGDSDEGSVVLASIRAGADDFLVRGRDDARLPGVVTRRLKPAAGAPVAVSESSARRVPMALLMASPLTADVVFFSAHLAKALAGTLGRRESGSRRVLLVDAGLPGGTLSILFGQTPDFYLEDALADVGRCDATLIDSVFPRLDSGVFFLCHPEGLAASEAMEPLSHLPALIDQLAPLFDDVVVVAETGSAEESLQNLLARARRTYLCMDTSVVHVRQAAALLTRLNAEAHDQKPPALVVTQQADPGGLNAERLGELLALPVAADLTDRLIERHRAMDEGRVLRACAASEAFVGAARDLAAEVSGRTDLVKEGMRESGRLRRAWQALRGAP